MCEYWDWCTCVNARTVVHVVYTMNVVYACMLACIFKLLNSCVH